MLEYQLQKLTTPPIVLEFTGMRTRLPPGSECFFDFFSIGIHAVTPLGIDLLFLLRCDNTARRRRRNRRQ